MSEYVRPRPESAALLTIDVQNDFTLPDAPACIEGTAEAVPRMRRLVEAFRTADAPVLHAVRLYRSDGSNVDVCRRADIESGAEIVRPGTNGAQLVEGLTPSADARFDDEGLLAGAFQAIGRREWVTYKPRWSAFHRTGLDDFLAARSVDTVVVCGCNFPNCPRATIYDASGRDYRLVFVPDATSGTYDRGVAELDDIGVAVRDTDEAVAWLTG
jgi:nicotinamidase-related amidase